MCLFTIDTASAKGILTDSPVSLVTPSIKYLEGWFVKHIAIRRWKRGQGTPVGEAYGNIDFLRDLPSVTGLGCYLVSVDRSRRKLDPTNHRRFIRGVNPPRVVVGVPAPQVIAHRAVQGGGTAPEHNFRRFG